jgi:hypothetical protein
MGSQTLSGLEGPLRYRKTWRHRGWPASHVVVAPTIADPDVADGGRRGIMTRERLLLALGGRGWGTKLVRRIECGGDGVLREWSGFGEKRLEVLHPVPRRYYRGFPIWIDSGNRSRGGRVDNRIGPRATCRKHTAAWRLTC